MDMSFGKKEFATRAASQSSSWIAVGWMASSIQRSRSILHRPAKHGKVVGTSQKWPAKAGGRSPKGPAVAGTTVPS